MKKNLFICTLVCFMLIFAFCAKADDNLEMDEDGQSVKIVYDKNGQAVVIVIRSTDPCQKNKIWGSGPNPLILDELKDGRADHIPFSRLLRLAGQENEINPVALAAIIEDRTKINSVSDKYTKDYEARSFIMGWYAVNEDGKTKYQGPYGQTIGATFQLAKARKNKMPFPVAYDLYFQGKSIEGFRTTYKQYANIVSWITGEKHSTDIGTQEQYVESVYNDFQDVTDNDLQRLLNIVNSPLKDRRFFKRWIRADSVPTCE